MSGVNELGVFVASMDVKHASGGVTPLNLGGTEKELGLHSTLAEAKSREQIGDTYDVCFQETKVPGIPFDKSIMQGGKESVSLFSMIFEGYFLSNCRRVGGGRALVSA